MQKKVIVIIIVFNLIIEFLTYSVHADDKTNPFLYDRNDTASRMLAGASSATGLYYPDSYNNKERYDAIDVSVFQGSINWQTVYNSGIRAAIIRVGGRGYGTGEIYGDAGFEANLINAKAAGLKVGVYFFSAAINEAEAEQEANYAINQVKNTGVSLDLPIYIDFEGDGNGGNNGGRVEANVNQYTGTRILKKFGDTVKANGYLPGIYAGYYFLDSYSNLSEVRGWNYSMWVAWYSNNALYNVPYTVEMWQYTGYGYVNGISSQYVDKNILFIDKPGKCTNLTYTIDKNDSSKATLKWDYINKINDYQIEITQGGRTTTKDVSIGGLILAANTMTSKVDLSEGTNKFRVRAINKKYGFEEIGAWSDYVTIQYENTYLKGDVTGDGIINIRDIIKIRKYIANQTKWKLTSEEMKRADVTGDSKISIRDIIKIRKYIAASSSESIKRKHPDWMW